MNQYRKKPVVIEAVQYLPGETCEQLAAFMDVAHNEEDCFHDAEWVIPTLEGDMVARPGDWIIRGVQGELYPCKPDIFAATYEPVDPASSRGVR